MTAVLRVTDLCDTWKVKCNYSNVTNIETFNHTWITSDVSANRLSRYFYLLQGGLQVDTIYASYALSAITTCCSVA